MGINSSQVGGITRQQQVDGPTVSASKAPPRTSNISASRTWGAAGTLGIDGCAAWTKRARPFNKAQLIIHGERNCVGLRAAIGASASYGDGINPKNAAGTNTALTLWTWGSTDPNDFSNPGGGQQFGSITNQSGTQNYPATAGWKEGDAYTDWMDIESLDRVDDPTNTWHLAFMRWSAIFNNSGSTQTILGVSVPTGNFTPGYRNVNGQTDLSTGATTQERHNLFGPIIEPENNQGYLNDYTRLTNAGLSTGLALSGTFGVGAVQATLRLVHTYDRMITLIVGGDSLVQGYFSGYGGGIDGWGRKARKYLIDAGYYAELVAACWTTERGDNTHWKVERAIRNKSGTHAVIPMYTVNDGGLGVQGLKDSLKRVAYLVSLAEAARIEPVVVLPMSGDATYDALMRTALEQYRLGGVRVVDIPALVGQSNRLAVRNEFSPQNDGIHYRDLFHDVVGRELARVIVAPVYATI